MKLKRIALVNFRGFTKIDIDFHNNITVIAGVNGSGKSSILKAIAGLASYLVPEISPAKRNVISFDDDDIQYGGRAFSIDMQFKGENIQTSAQVLRSIPDPHKIKDYQQEVEDLRAKRRFLKKESKEDNDIFARIITLEHILGDSEDVFMHQSIPIEAATDKTKPSELLVVLYPTNRHFTNLPTRLAVVKATTTSDAYANALHAKSISLNDFAHWFRAIKNGSIGNDDFCKTIIEMLESTIANMLPGFHNLDIDTTRKPRFTIEKEGKRLSLNQLSDGERGLLALAFDLTRRLTIANPEKKNPVQEGEAIVLIDETELHLHPKWQREVLRRLTTTFKNCQFIVTTHSPQVIGEVKAGSLRLLSTNENKIFVETPGMAYGTDSNWILNVLMGGKDMNADVEQELNNINKCISEKELDTAETLIQALRDKVGNTVSIQKASSIIERMRVLGR